MNRSPVGENDRVKGVPKSSGGLQRQPNPKSGQDYLTTDRAAGQGCLLTGSPPSVLSIAVSTWAGRLGAWMSTPFLRRKLRLIAARMSSMAVTGEVMIRKKLTSSEWTTKRCWTNDAMISIDITRQNEASVLARVGA